MELRTQILQLLGFSEGTLLFKYLGVPVIASRLSKADCCHLVNIITAKVRSWSQRFLSFTGRLQLITSVLHATQVYWTSVFILPKSILSSIEKILRQFLWKGPDLGVGGAKVPRNKVYLPKEEGGFNIRKLEDYNRATMLKHIWLLFIDKESLWCQWIHSNFLQKKYFWVATKLTFCSWSWKKILELRSDVQLNFLWKIGDGAFVSFWFDNWHPKGPLYKFFFR